jgi:glc operon protein GlcG
MGRILWEVKGLATFLEHQLPVVFRGLAAVSRVVGPPPATATVMLCGFQRDFFPRIHPMKNRLQLEFEDVCKVAAAAHAEAVRNGWAVSIAIVDDGGHLLHFQRLDGVAAISSAIAPAKAQTAALGRRESKVYEDMINSGRQSFLSAPVLHGMLEGGVPILKDGQCLGAVGVSGVKSHEDAQIAKAGIAALGL